MPNNVYSETICQICDNDTGKIFYGNCQANCKPILCELCLNKLFFHSETISCPFCRSQIKRKDFFEKTQEEIEFENEMRIRNDMSKMFCQKIQRRTRILYISG